MMRTRPLPIAAFVLGTVFFPVAVTAQEPVTPAINTAVSSGQKVVLNLKSGSIRDGVVFGTSANTVELEVNGRKETIPAADISSITLVYRDPVSDGAKKGALIGLVIGAAIGVTGALTACGEDTFLDLCSPPGFLLLGGVLGGYGAGIGAVTGLVGDASRMSRREVWRPSGSGRMTWSASAGPGLAGARLTVRW